MIGPYVAFTSDYNYYVALASGDSVVDGLQTITKKQEAIATATAINITNFPLASATSTYIVLQDDKVLMTGLVDGSDTTTDAGQIEYELATPIQTNTNNTNLNRKSDGDVIVENKFSLRSFQYATAGIDLTNTGYNSQTISEATVIDFDLNAERILDVSNFVETVVGTNIFTNADLAEGDWIGIEVEYSDGRTIPTTVFNYNMNQAATIASNTAAITQLSKINESQDKDIRGLQVKSNPFMEVTKTGDDKGTIFTEQLSIGSIDNGIELVVGEGDSTTKTMIVLQTDDNITYTDKTIIAASDTSSTLGLFNGTATGKTTYVGGDFKFFGLKVKIDIDGLMESENIITEYWNGTEWFSVRYMATSSNPPLRQFAWNLAQNSNGSEQWRYNHDPYNDNADWEMNSVDGVVKYWTRMRVVTTITTDAIIEQIKLHTNRTQFKQNGSEEFMGTSRPVLHILSGMGNTQQNVAKNPSSQNITYTTNMVADVNNNVLANNTEDGFIIPITIPANLDTSIPIELTVSGYPVSNVAGVVKFQVDVLYLKKPFAFNGSPAIDFSTTAIDTVPINSGDDLRDAKFRMPLYSLVPGEKAVLSFYRLGNDPEDTLTGSVIIENIDIDGYTWKA